MIQVQIPPDVTQFYVSVPIETPQIPVFPGSPVIPKPNNSQIFIFDERVFLFAIEKGDMELLQWLVEQGYPISQEAFNTAVKRGNVGLVNWLIDQGCPWSSKTKILKENGSYADMKLAAENSDLNMLKLCHQDGIALTKTIFQIALSNGDFQIIHWLCEKGCPKEIDECYGAMKLAAEKGNLKFLKKFHRDGFALTKAIFQAAQKSRNEEVSQWLREHKNCTARGVKINKAEACKK